MELMQLAMLVAVVEEGSVHRAAERVCRTSPAVSMAMRKLEDQIGTALFERSPRSNYCLTPAGALLLRYAKELLQLRDEAETAIRDLNRLEHGRLRIGAIESISVYFLPQLTKIFLKEHPRIRFEVSCKNSEELLGELQERKLDIALLACLPEHSDWEAQMIMPDKLVLIVSPQHSLAKQVSIRLEELRNELIIVEGASSTMYDKLVNAFSHASSSLHIHIESAAIETIKKMVAMNVGIGFVPYLCVQEELAQKELAMVEVHDLCLERKLWAIRRRTGAHSAACEQFMKDVGRFSKEWSKENGMASLQDGKRGASTGVIKTPNAHRISRRQSKRTAAVVPIRSWRKEA